MKTVKRNIHKILAASAALALSGIALSGSAHAGHDDYRSGRGAMHDARALDRLTDRLHTVAKRELRYGRDSRRILARICALEDRADRLRSSMENRVPAAAVSRLACSVEDSARDVVGLLRRARVGCELNELAVATLDHARSITSAFSGNRFDRFDRHDHQHDDHDFNQEADHGYGRVDAWRPARDVHVHVERRFPYRGY